MKFEIKWVGYEETTLEPWSKNIWNLQVMHEYLRANKLKQLLPTAFKNK